MTAISFNGTTWTTTETVTPVLDVLGEPCIQGAVTLTARTPATTGTGTGVRNGTMVNPVSLRLQGYDGRMGVGLRDNFQGYDAGLNVETALPYSVGTGKSVCSMESGNLGQTDPDLAGNWSMLEKFACLSVMASVPAAGTFFRPPYAGTDKPVYLTSQVRTDWLPNHPVIGDPISDQDYGTDICPDGIQWLTLPQYHVIQPTEPPNNRMAPVYQQKSYVAEQGIRVGQIAMLAASDHAKRVQCLHQIIKLGIDCAYALKATSNGLFLNGAGYGTGGYFLAIAVAGHYLEDPVILEVLTRDWEFANGQYKGPNPDLVGKRVGAFWESTTPYSSTTAWDGYALPKDRSLYPNGPALYGDARDALGVVINGEARKDPDFVYHANNIAFIRYTEGFNNWGSYYRNSMPAFVGQFSAARLLGVDQYYPAAAADLYYQHINDYKMWHDQDYSANAYLRDIYGFGGTGNGFVYDMITTYAGLAPPSEPVFRGSMTLRVTV